MSKEPKLLDVENISFIDVIFSMMRTKLCATWCPDETIQGTPTPFDGPRKTIWVKENGKQNQAMVKTNINVRVKS